MASAGEKPGIKAAQNPSATPTAEAASKPPEPAPEPAAAAAPTATLASPEQPKDASQPAPSSAPASATVAMHSTVETATAMPESGLSGHKIIAVLVFMAVAIGAGGLWLLLRRSRAPRASLITRSLEREQE